MLGLNFDLSDLEEKSAQLRRVMSAKIDELEQSAPQTGLRDYFVTLSENFEEVLFDPLPDVWEEELRRILDHDRVDENDADTTSDPDATDATGGTDSGNSENGNTEDLDSSAGL